MDQQKKKSSRFRSDALRFGLAIVCLLLLFLISFSVGRFPVTMSDLLKAGFR